jgi:uncharacterized membrane protein
MDISRGLITITLWSGVILGAIGLLLIQIYTKLINRILKKNKDKKKAFFKAYGKQALTALKDWDQDNE